MSVDEFSERIAEGSAGMPAYAERLEARHIAALLLYLDDRAGLEISESLVAIGAPASDGLCITCHGNNGQRFPQDGGAAIYARECWSCHGSEGDSLAGISLFDRTYLETLGDAALLASVSVGRGAMGGFAESLGGPLSETQVREVIVHLNQRAGRNSPVSMAAIGEQIYTTSCAICHGERGDRIPVSPLDTRGFVAAFSDEELVEIMLDGRGTMVGLGVRAGGELTPIDALSVAAYLRYRVDAQTVRNVAAGRDLYLNGCVSCHGIDGSGVRGVDLASAAFITSLPDSRLAAAIQRDSLQGERLSATRSRGSLTFQTAALLGYLKAWAGVDASAALPLSSVRLEGEALYQRNCTACHGDSGNRVPGVQLKSPVFLALRSKAVVATTIRSGNDRGMPAWGQASGGPLSNADVDAVVSYLYETAELFGDGTLAGQMLGDTEGAQLFATLCAGCHGIDRSGVIGPPLLPETLRQSDAFYRQTIIEGRPGTRMPAWGEKGLTDEQITSLLIFLRTDPVAVGMSSFVSAGIGEQLFGAELFRSTCVLCHGEDGLGVPQCPLGSSSWLANLSPGELERRISHGKPGAGMPRWLESLGGPLSEEQIASVADYIRQSWQ